MEFWNAIVGLMRRKAVGIPIIMLSVLAGALVFLATPVDYMSSTTMVLTTPASGGTLSQDPQRPTGLTNPLLNFDNGLKTTSAILIQAMNTPEVAKELGVAGGPTKLTVDDGSTNPNLLDTNGPFVYIVGVSTSPSAAKNIVVMAQARMRTDLIERQRALNAPPITFITMVDVVSPSAPTVTEAKKFKLGGVALAVVFLGALTTAYTAARLRADRRRRGRIAVDEDASAAESHDSGLPRPANEPPTRKALIPSAPASGDVDRSSPQSEVDQTAAGHAEADSDTKAPASRSRRMGLSNNRRAEANAPSKDASRQISPSVEPGPAVPRGVSESRLEVPPERKTDQSESRKPRSRNRQKSVGMRVPPRSAVASDLSDEYERADLAQGPAYSTPTR